MKVSIYFSAEQILMIGHDGGAAKKFIAHPLSEGVVYNGAIIDSGMLVDALNKIKAGNAGLFKGEVSLIIDGSSILMRRVSTPKLNAKSYKQLVRDEFSDTAQDAGEIVCGYRELRVGENAIIGFSANREQVEKYISVFSDAGIKLSAIHIGMEAIISFVETKPAMQTGTFVLNLVDGMTMLTMLFVSGINVFMSRSRLYGEDREQMLGNILDNLNGIVQFTQSQRVGELTRSYYLGLNAEELRRISDRNHHSSISIENLQVYEGPGGSPPPETHFCCLNMRLTGRKVNLVSVRKEQGSFTKDKKPGKTWIFLLALLVIGLVGPSVYLFMQVSGLDSDISRVSGQINSPNTQMRLVELDLLNQENAFLNDVNAQEGIMENYHRTLTPVERSMLEFFLFNHGEEVTVRSISYDSMSRTVNLSAVCPDATVSADYVDVLYASGRVERVTYRGYGYEGDLYAFTVEILLIVEEVLELEEME